MSQCSYCVVTATFTGSSWAGNAAPGASDDVILQSGASYYLSTGTVQSINSLNLTALSGDTTRINFRGKSVRPLGMLDLIPSASEPLSVRLAAGASCPRLSVTGTTLWVSTSGSGQVLLDADSSYDCTVTALEASLTLASSVSLELNGALVVDNRHTAATTGTTVFLMDVRSASAAPVLMYPGASLALTGATQLVVASTQLSCPSGPCTITVSSTSVRSTSSGLTPYSTTLGLALPTGTSSSDGLRVVFTASNTFAFDAGGVHASAVCVFVVLDVRVGWLVFTSLPLPSLVWLLQLRACSPVVWW